MGKTRVSCAETNPVMNHALIVSESILIHATPEKVWETLTTPAIIKEYLFGTETSTDWKVGSKITFQGVYGPDNQHYCDKGVVIENAPTRTLRYSYWSGFCGLEDSPENYAMVTYGLEQNEGETKFTWTQQGYPDEARRQHSQKGINALLAQIKAIAERP